MSNPYVQNKFLRKINHRGQPRNARRSFGLDLPLHRWDLPTIWKTRYLQTHNEEFCECVWKFRSTGSSEPTERQSGPDVFEESRLVMTFLTSLGVTWIFCSFRLVLEWKEGKEILESSRLEFIEKFSANNFSLSDAEDNTSGSLQYIPLFRTLLAVYKKFPRIFFY